MIWILTGDISSFDGKTWLTYTNVDGLIAQEIHVIAVSLDGTIWSGARYSGLSSFDGEIWRRYNVKDGLNELSFS